MIIFNFMQIHIETINLEIKKGINNLYLKIYTVDNYNCMLVLK